EKEGRFEEANVYFHRVYTKSPDTLKYRKAFLRTADKTTEDLLIRYDKYIKENKYFMAYRRLEQAHTLTPDHPRVKEELKKWYMILLAGKLDLVEMKSMSNQIPLTDQIILEVRINTPNITRILEAPVDYLTGIFSVEDILYDPPQNLLMLYSINSIGVKLHSNTSKRSQFKKFIDFKTPVLVDVRGNLDSQDNEYSPIDQYFPLEILESSNKKGYWFPARGIRYSLNLDKSSIRVKSSANQIDFLPQILYINKQDRRFFLDFGHLQVMQKKVGGMWSYRRTVRKEREYLANLKNNLLLNPYFYFREGGYPFVMVTE
ncbi:hypothetical protein KKA14_19205, partial [bacterium]|nr:hypothetical protein [bacterium]